MLRSYSYVDVHNNIKHQFWLLTCYPVPCRVHGCVFGGQGELSVSYLLEFRASDPKRWRQYINTARSPASLSCPLNTLHAGMNATMASPLATTLTLSLWLTVSSGPKR